VYIITQLNKRRLYLSIGLLLRLQLPPGEEHLLPGTKQEAAGNYLIFFRQIHGTNRTMTKPNVLSS
jgi:hypothetical protein